MKTPTRILAASLDPKIFYRNPIMESLVRCQKALCCDTLYCVLSPAYSLIVGGWRSKRSLFGLKKDETKVDGLMSQQAQ
jgi:hypothetical protein